MIEWFCFVACYSSSDHGPLLNEPLFDNCDCLETCWCAPVTVEVARIVSVVNLITDRVGVMYVFFMLMEDEIDK